MKITFVLFLLLVYSKTKNMNKQINLQIIDNPKIDVDLISKAILDSKVNGKQLYLNPLQINNAPSLKKEPERFVKIRNIREMFGSMRDSYYHLLKKFNKKVAEKIKLPSFIQCNTFEGNLSKPEYVDHLYKTVHSINKNNYKKTQRMILNALKRIMLEVGNGCSNLIEFIDYFKHSINKDRFLLRKSFHNPWLLLQILSSRSKFISSWGKFIKMGHYLGTMMAWFKIYSPIKKKSLKRRKKKRYNSRRLHKKKVKRFNQFIK